MTTYAYKKHMALHWRIFKTLANYYMDIFSVNFGWFMCSICMFLSDADIHLLYFDK